MAENRLDLDDDAAGIESGDAVGRIFFDKLLLAIIDANPMPEFESMSALRRRHARKHRLEEARSALLGTAASVGRPELADAHALRWMGQQAFDDLARQGAARLPKPPEFAAQFHKPRSDRELADAASAKFFGASGAAERLRAKFRNEREKWIMVARYHDDVPEQIEANELLIISRILSRHDVAMTIDSIDD